MISCHWCGKEVVFDHSRGGWIHRATGKLYATRRDADGIERDDHCALPSYS
jgi:hypothetical protein